MSARVKSHARTFVPSTCKLLHRDCDFCYISSTRLTSLHPTLAPETTMAVTSPFQQLYKHALPTHHSASPPPSIHNIQHRYPDTRYQQIMATNPNLIFAMQSIASTIPVSKPPTAHTTIATSLGPHGLALTRTKDPRHGCINGIKISTCKMCAGHVSRT